MAWVAVDKDGTEKIFASAPLRRNKYKSHLFLYFLFSHLPYTKNQRYKWAAYWSTDETDPLPEGAIILPKGSIKKLIGRDITWKDDPVELKEE